jgi:hypothetical protein
MEVGGEASGAVRVDDVLADADGGCERYEQSRAVHRLVRTGST